MLNCYILFYSVYMLVDYIVNWNEQCFCMTEAVQEKLAILMDFSCDFYFVIVILGNVKEN